MANKSEKDNPLPFRQPFLELVVDGDQKNKFLPDCPFFLIDVDGQIEKYIDSENAPTELLIEIFKEFAKAGVMVIEYGIYKGSAGPHLILRNGVLFQRMKDVESPPKSVFAYEYRPPKHRGP